MLEEIKKQFTSIQILITLLILAVGIYIFQIVWQLLGNFSDVFIILLSAWLISFILEPMVNKLTRLTRLQKVLSAIIIYAVFLGILTAVVFLFFPTVSSQLQILLRILPKYFSSFPSFLNKWGDILTTFLNNSLFFIPSVASFFFSLFIVLIISFYLVVDKEKIIQEVFHLIPKKWHKDIHFILEVIDTTFAAFIRVQILFGLVIGFATWGVLRIFSIDFAASTAFIAGILTVVPLIGPVLGIIPPLLVAFITDPAKALLVLIVLLIIQQIVFNIIAPKLLSKTFQLHPIIVLLSFIVGLKVAGPVGAIFGVPVLGILTIVFHRISHYFINNSEK